MSGKRKKIKQLILLGFCHICRHIIRYMKQLFFNRETWSDCNEQLFLAQAHACAIESLKNVYDPSDGKQHPSHLLDQSCVYVHKVS